MTTKLITNTTYTSKTTGRTYLIDDKGNATLVVEETYQDDYDMCECEIDWDCGCGSQRRYAAARDF